MSKPLVILADTDSKYMETLERKFLEEIGPLVELEIITSEEYFAEYFAKPKTAEILVVGEHLYSQDLQRHNLAHAFVMKEENELGETDDLLFTPVYKYAAVKDLFHELTYQSQNRIYADSEEKQATQVIALYSAIGGSGKTTLSLGIAADLARNHRRVLYLNSESIQSFQYYLKDKNGIQSEAYRALRADDSMIYANLRGFLKKEEFAYLPPFTATLDALNIDSHIYVDLLQAAKESHDFDFIVLDIEAGYDRTKTQLLGAADKVIMVMTQEASAVAKTEWLLRNIDFNDPEKYIFVCNKYSGGEEDAYFASSIQKHFPLQDRVPRWELPISNLSDIARVSEIQKLAYMFV